ncbi:MAG: AmmeMemoRadiSam system protein B [Candidatus Thermochlorobacter sp.]
MNEALLLQPQNQGEKMLTIFRTVRKPMFAGKLYPEQPDVLADMIDRACIAASTENLGEIKAMLLPYASYDEVLPVLAKAYKQVENLSPDLVVFIAPAVDTFHRIAMSGFAAFETPLGKVELSDYVRNELCDEDDDFFISEEGLPKGYSIETQLPILQRTIGKRAPFKILPILMGEQTVDLCDEAATALSEVLMSKKILVIGHCNFNAAYQDEMLQNYLSALEALKYDELMRYNVMYGKKFGTGLGIAAIVARIAKELSAKHVSKIAEALSSNKENLYLAISFSKAQTDWARRV